MVSLLVESFVRVTVLLSPAEPTSLLPKLSSDVDVVTSVPCPVKVTTCGLLGPLSVMVSVPVRVPVAFGAKITLTLQLTSTPSEPLQALVCVKSPEVTILEMVIFVVPQFPISTISGWLLLLTFCAGKVTSSGETTGQTRWFRTSGGSGVWLKSKLSSRSLASASRAVSEGSPKRSSTVFRNDAYSYRVWETNPGFAYGDMTRSGTRGPSP